MVAPLIIHCCKVQKIKRQDTLEKKKSFLKYISSLNGELSLIIATLLIVSRNNYDMDYEIGREIRCTEGILYQATQWEDTEIQQRSLSEEEVKVVFY